MPTQADLDANRFQYRTEDYVTSTPEGDVQAISYSPRYLTDLLGMRQRVYSGEASPWERQNYEMQAEAARAIAMRDVSQLQAGHEGENALHGGSPDLGAVMLSLAERIESGKASEQERGLFDETYRMMADQTYRSVVPQASDAFNPMGDNLFGALGVIGLGASGGLAAGALAGGGLGLAGTLGAGGTLASTAGTGLSTLGGALQEPGLQRAGLALGALGGVAGGAGGLANLWGTGVQNLSDAARLASSAGRITGAVGSASGNEGLSQAGRYLGQAGQLGQVGSGVLPESVTDWSTQRGSPMDWDYWGSGDYPGDDVWAGGSPTFSEGGGGGWGYDPSTMEFQQNPLYEGGTPGGGGWGYDPATGTFSNSPTTGESGSGGNWLASLLGGAGQVGRFLGQNASWLSPLAGAAGGVASGAIGSNAAGNAAQWQAAAAHRGLDLQTAQWLQQQQNLAPYLQAGQQGLGQLQQLYGRQQPALPGATASIDPRAYQMPNATPQWAPQAYQGPAPVNAADYRWNPQAGPQAANYRYAPGQTPDAAGYRWNPQPGPHAANYRYTPGQTPNATQYASGPPQLYQGAMPGTQVSTLTGQQVLDQDPGAAFRQTEARKALEASAFARGGGLSGAAGSALQARSQDLASQEYGNAWQRMMARDTEQYGRNWGQYQQNWNQGVQGTQLGLQTNAQNFGQALNASQLREQVNQVASQQGWNQAQTEAAFREQMAQQSSQQGFGQAEAASRLREQVNQVASQQGWSQAQAEAVFREQMAGQSQAQNWTSALQGQQTGWNQGLEAQKWMQVQNQLMSDQMYNRNWDQYKTTLGMDVARNETDYQRQQNLYKQQLGQFMLPWEQASAFANYGQQAVNMYGQQGQSATNAMANLLTQQGNAQAQGALGGANAWQNALQNINTGFQGYNANQEAALWREAILGRRGLNA